MGQYDEGYITAEERKEAVTGQWDQATEEVGQAMEDNLDELNPIFMMANSGARGSFKQIRQLAGMRGLMANPKGEIIERPIKANFMEGLIRARVLHLDPRRPQGPRRHRAAHRRLGLPDPPPGRRRPGRDRPRSRTARPRTSSRCRSAATTASSNPNLLGRVVAKKFTTKRGRDLLKRNQMIDKPEIARARRGLRADDEDVDRPGPLGRSSARPSPGSAASATASCPRPATLVEIGDAVGIIAAQSIGEPGTQLTMRTFHTGGVAGLDITQGLPRVVELFEARKPKGLAQIAEVAGKVSVEETDKAVKVTITDDKGEEHDYSFPARTNLYVETGQKVEPGTQLNEGSLYPAEILAIRGRTETEQYIVAEVQRVYRTQGVDINDKHIELIVRQMLKKVRVDSKGSTELLPGQLEDRLAFEAINEKFKGKKTKTPAKAEDGDPRDHQGLAGDGVLPLGRLLPGDDQGAHRRRPRGQARPPRWA